MMISKKIIFYLLFVSEIRFSEFQGLIDTGVFSDNIDNDILQKMKEIQNELYSQRQQALQNSRLMNNRLFKFETEFFNYRKEWLEGIVFLENELNDTKYRVNEIETNVNSLKGMKF